MFNVNEKFDKDENVLFNAIPKCDFNMAKFLISKGVNVNDRNNKLQTPLMKAVINKCDTEFVTMLIENGANTKIRDRDRMTALIYAAGNSQKMFELFMTLNPNFYNYDIYGEIEKFLFMAVQNGVFDVAQLLLKKGGCINSKNSDGQTLLIVAIKSGSLGMVKFLVDNGANVNGRNNGGYTALSYSNCYFCAEFNRAITQYLKSVGAK
jgi:ankyrin repeat protein